jgi:hypothetical protein
MNRLLWVLFLISVILRGADLISDSPPRLGDSGGYWADEGFWTHNARNEVLFGSSVLDEWNNRYASPLTHWPTLWSFELFGVGLPQARIVPVILSFFSIIILARGLGRNAALFGAFLFAWNILLVHFGRLALLEAPVILLLLIAWYTLSSPLPGPGRLFVAGLAMGFAVGIKLTVWNVVPAAFAALLLAPGARGRLSSCLFTAMGLFGAILIWLALVGKGLPLFWQYTTYYSSQQAPWIGRLVENITHPVLFSRFSATPLLLAAGFLTAACVLGALGQTQIPRHILLCSFWFCLGVLYLDTLTYGPLRYYIPLLVPLVILTAWSLEKLWEGQFDLRLSAVGLGFILLFLWPFLWETLCAWKPHILWWGVWRRAVLLFLIAAGVSGAWVLLRRLLRSLRCARCAGGLLLLAYVALHGTQYGQWTRSRTRDIYDTGRALGTRLENAVLTGQWAPVLCLENHHGAVPVWPGFVNGSEPFSTYHITHGVIWDRHWDRFREWFPDEFNHAAILDTLWIKESPVLLCSFASEHTPPGSASIADD